MEIIELTDLKKSITDFLKQYKLKIYDNNVKEGFSRPSFFTQILPISGTDLYKSDLFENSYLVEINYFSKLKTDLDNYKMSDDLKEKLFPHLKVKDRKLIIKEFKSEINDGVLSTRFNLNWLDYIAKEEVEEKMQNVEIRFEE